MLQTLVGIDPATMLPMAKLTLRDLFWFVALCAVLVAWWVDRSRLDTLNDDLAKKHQEAERENGRLRTVLRNFGGDTLAPWEW
jgi:cell division protein FtsL